MIYKLFKMTRITTRIAATFAVLLFIILLTLNAAVSYGIRYYLLNQAYIYVDQVSKLLTDKIIKSYNKEDLLTRDLFSDITASENVHVKLYDEYGNLIIQSSRFDYLIPSNAIVNKSIKKEVKDKEMIYKNVFVTNKSGKGVYIQIIKDLDNEYDFMQILIIAMVFTDIIGLFLAIFVGLTVSKTILNPINQITDAAEKISAQNLKTRIDISGPDDELSRLAKTFNNMIDRLQNAFERQNRFVSDASHELRTPIAVIQGYANMLLRWGKDDKNVLEEAIVAIKNESEGMQAIVEKLLFIARGDQGKFKIHLEEFYLNQLMDEIIKETKMITNKQVILQQNDAVKIESDRKLLKEMIRIFIDNSLKFTDDNGILKIRLLNMHEHIRIIIEDNGIGIPKEDIPLLFDRFYRVDEARNKEKGGHGLGLSIAKLIADNLDCKINIQSEVGKGTKIEITKAKI